MSLRRVTSIEGESITVKLTAQVKSHGNLVITAVISYCACSTKYMEPNCFVEHAQYEIRALGTRLNHTAAKIHSAREEKWSVERKHKINHMKYYQTTCHSLKYSRRAQERGQKTEGLY